MRGPTRSGPFPPSIFPTRDVRRLRDEAQQVSWVHDGVLGLVGFSAVYLNHHYLIDVILGVFYGLVAAPITIAVTDWLAARRSSRSDGAISG